MWRTCYSHHQKDLEWTWNVVLISTYTNVLSYILSSNKINFIGDQYAQHENSPSLSFLSLFRMKVELNILKKE